MRLHSNLDKLQTWSDIWLLKFNTSKFKRMHLGRNNEEYRYTLQEGENRRELELVEN